MIRGSFFIMSVTVTRNGYVTITLNYYVTGFAQFLAVPLHRIPEQGSADDPLSINLITTNKMKNLMKVMNCGEMFTVRSEKAEGGSLNKRNLILQEIGGKYENQYAVTVLGNLAQTVFHPGEYVWAALRFQTREYNGQVFQDITATDIIKVIN